MQWTDDKSIAWYWRKYGFCTILSLNVILILVWIRVDHKCKNSMWLSMRSVLLENKYNSECVRNWHLFSDLLKNNIHYEYKDYTLYFQYFPGFNTKSLHTLYYICDNPLNKYTRIQHILVSVLVLADNARKMTDLCWIFTSMHLYRVFYTKHTFEQP